MFLNILCHNGGMSEPGKVVEVEIAGLLLVEASTSIPEGGVEVKKMGLLDRVGLAIQMFEQHLMY